MAKFSKFPTGLLEQLSSKHLGRAPDNLLDDVRPTVDLDPYWSYVNADVTVATGNVTNVGTNLTLVVPDGEMWMLRAVFGAVLGTNVADTCHLALFLLAPGTATPIFIHANDTLFTIASANDFFTLAKTIERPFLIGPGWSVGIQPQSVSWGVGVHPADVGAFYTRIPLE